MNLLLAIIAGLAIGTIGSVLIGDSAHPGRRYWIAYGAGTAVAVALAILTEPGFAAGFSALLVTSP